MFAVALSVMGCKTIQCEKYPTVYSTCQCNCCIDFDAKGFTVGTTYNGPVGSPVFKACDFDVSIENLVIGGAPYFNFAKIEVAPAGFGSGNIINTNNVTLLFKNTGSSVSTITFDYLDMGGSENLTVNGALHSGDLNAAPPSLGGVAVSVAEATVPNGRMGIVTLSGNIKVFGVGGQEFYLDNVCRR